MGLPLRHEERVVIVGFSQDGSLLLTGSCSLAGQKPHGEARLWRLAPGRLPELVYALPHGRRMQAALSPDGRIALTAGTAAMFAWDLETGKQSHEFVAPKRDTWKAAFSPDGRTVVTAHARDAWL